jgi:hypothetical protein
MFVVPNALSPQQVDEANALLDAREAAHASGSLAEVGASTNRVVEPLRDNPLHFSPVFRAMLDNPRISPLLEELIGSHGGGWTDIGEQMPSFRIDHVNVNHFRSNPGTQLHNSGDGSSHAGGSQFSRYQDGRFFNGLLVVAFELKDTTPNGGGFGCIPGSHKANVSMPEGLRDLSRGGSGPPNLRRVPARAGDAIVFTEVRARCTG